MPEAPFNESMCMKYFMLLVLVGLAALPLAAHASNDVCTSCSNSDDQADGDDGLIDATPDDPALQGDPTGSLGLGMDGGPIMGDESAGVPGGGADLPQLDPLTPQPEPSGLPQ
jgi:hypothetical protein